MEYIEIRKLSMILRDAMGSQRSGRHLESFLEVARFFLIESGPISNHMDPIRPDLYDFRYNTFNGLS